MNNKSQTTDNSAWRLSRRQLLRASAIGLGGAFLAACAPAGPSGAPSTGAASESSQPVTITHMIWGGADREEARLQAYSSLYPETAERIKVEVVSPGNHDAEVYQAIRLSLAAGGADLPDLVTFNYIGVPEFAEAGQLIDIEEMMAPYLDDLTTGAKAVATYDNTYVAIPRQLKAKLWYYRQDLFDEAGIKVDDVVTFEDYLAAGEQYHAHFGDSFIMNIGPQPIHYWYFMILSHWEEVRVADKDGNYLITEDPHFAEMLEWLKTWYTSGISFNTDDWSPDWQPAFADETIGASLISNWFSGFLPQFAPEQGGLWKIALWPEFNRTGSEAGGGCLCIPKGAAHPEAAFEFSAKMFLDTEGAVDEWKRTGNPPSTLSAQDRVRQVAAELEQPEGMSDEEWKITPINYFGSDFMEPIFQALEVLKVFPYDPSASAELDILRRQTEAYLADEKSLEEALAGAQGDMEAQIGNPYA